MKRRQLRLITEQKVTRALSWRERIIKSFGKDPVKGRCLEWHVLNLKEHLCQEDKTFDLFIS